MEPGGGADPWELWALEAESSVLLLPASAELTILQWDSGFSRGYNQDTCLVVFGLRGRVPIVALLSGGELLS